MRHFILLLALLAATPLTAQDDDPKWITLMFQGENDAIAPVDQTDEFYTTGLRFYGLRNPNASPAWVEEFSQWWCRWACPLGAYSQYSLGFAIGQQIYTPDDISIAELIPDDRPYTAWLYVALLLNMTDESATRQHTFELQVGVLGPEAGGEWVQTEFHQLIGSELPRGWDNQLSTQAGLNLIYRYRKSFGLARTRRHFDIVPHLGANLGNIMVTANSGFTARAGWNISGFPQSEIPATLALDPSGGSGSSGLKRKNWEFYFFVGAEGRAVAHNIFLGGTDHTIDEKDFVYDLKAGLSFRIGDWRVLYNFVRRGEEFFPRRGELDGLHDYGSISIGIERAFKGR